MNLLQAIEQAGNNWFRPVSMRGTGSSFSSDDFDFISFQGDKYLEHGKFTCDARTILGEWEIVTPEQVMAERK